MENLIPTLIKFMSLIGNHKSMTGHEKKQWVLNRLKEEIKIDEQIINIIVEIIDYIILIDKGNIKINPKIEKNFFNCCK